MKLTVRFGDFPLVVNDFIHTGYMPPIKYRTIQIELTHEQQLLLAPKKLGVLSGETIYETMEVISLECGN